jgi:hypothetical protein
VAAGDPSADTRKHHDHLPRGAKTVIFGGKWRGFFGAIWQGYVQEFARFRARRRPAVRPGGGIGEPEPAAVGDRLCARRG